MSVSMELATNNILISINQLQKYIKKILIKILLLCIVKPIIQKHHILEYVHEYKLFNYYFLHLKAPFRARLTKNRILILILENKITSFKGSFGS